MYFLPSLLTYSTPPQHPTIAASLAGASYQRGKSLLSNAGAVPPPGWQATQTEEEAAMDPSGMQNRLSGGKRRKDAYSGEEEVVHDNQKMSRRWMTGRGDEIDSKDHLSQVNQALEFRGMSVDHWMRLQQQQQQKMEPAAPTTPLNNLQQPLNLQQRAMATAAMHDVVRNVDSSKQTLLAPAPSPQQLATPQQSAHQQQMGQMSQMGPMGQMGVQIGQQQQQIQQQQHTGQQQQQQQHSSQQQPCSSGVALVHNKFQHLNSVEQQMPQQQIQMPFLDISGSSSRPMSTLPPLPLSFRPPPIFAEADLRHSPTSSSSNQYPLQNVMSQQQQQQQQRLPPQGSTLLPDPDEDRYSSMLSNQSILSNQSSVLQQQQQQQSSNTGGLSGISGMSGTSNSLVGLQELQASAAWYSSMRELDSQPPSNSRLGRANLSNSPNVAQNINLYSSPTLSDLTSQSGLAPLPYQSCPSGSSSFRESPLDQDQLLGSDPQSPLPYGVAGCSSSSSVVGPKCSSSPLPRLNNKPVFQTDFPRRGGIMNGPYSASSSGPDLLLNQNIMSGGSGLLPDENCFIQRAPPMPKPVRTYTKVYKMGAIGRALDVTRFSNYTELRCELARMFNLEGQLDQRSGWQLVFLDNENDILLVGDDPWDEFVTSVRGIRILSPSEVFFYMNEERFGAAHNTMNPGSLKQY